MTFDPKVRRARGRIVSQAPVVRCTDDFVSEAERQSLLAIIDDEQRLREAGVTPAEDPCGIVFELPISLDPLLEEITQRIFRSVGIEGSVYSLRVRRYGIAQGHGLHHDGYEVAGAHLVASAALYLEQPDDGGATTFPDAAPKPARLEPHAGRLVHWYNYLPNGDVDDRSQHQSDPVVAGRKTVLLAFVYRSLDDWRSATALHTRDPLATPSPTHTLTCVDDNVPTETISLMREACVKRDVAFRHVLARNVDFTAVRPLPPGSMLYRPAISRTAIHVEQALFGPGVATFSAQDDGPYFSYTNAQRLFERHGVPHPRMVICTRTERSYLDRCAEHVGGYPLVLKVLGGSSGVGVIRVESPASLYSTMDYLSAQGVAPQLMAYVPDAVHWRVVTVGDQAVAAYRNHEDANDFRTHAKGEEEDYFSKVPKRLAAVAVRAARALRLEHSGVDVLEHRSGRLYVLEANYPCYYAQAQVSANIDVAGAMLDYLMAKAKRLSRREQRRVRAQAN